MHDLFLNIFTAKICEKRKSERIYNAMIVDIYIMYTCVYAYKSVYREKCGTFHIIITILNSNHIKIV